MESVALLFMLLVREVIFRFGPPAFIVGVAVVASKNLRGALSRGQLHLPCF